MGVDCLGQLQTLSLAACSNSQSACGQLGSFLMMQAEWPYWGLNAELHDGQQMACFDKQVKAQL